jgi:hypothetical protein
MKAVLSIFTIFLFLTAHPAFCQKSKKKVSEKIKSQQKSNLPKVEDYSYPYYTLINNASTPISGCFINYKNQSYFVSTRHSFYTPVNEKRKITKVMIFIDPNDLKNTAKVLSIDMTDQKILPVCFDSGCTDIVLIPVSIPKELHVNYVNLDSKETIQDKEMSIVGYVKDSLTIIKTKFHSILPRDTTYFLTEKSSVKDQAGSPVLIYSKVKGKGVIPKVILAGVYSGKELSQEFFDKGLIARANFIIKFLDSKKKADLAVSME